MSTPINDILKSIYTDPGNSAGFSSLQKLLSKAKTVNPEITKKDVANFLNSQDSFTLYGVNKRNFLKRPVYVPGPNSIMGADLMDMSNFSEFNQGVKFILVTIDCFSRYIDLRLLKNKQGATVARAFE